MSIVKPWHPSCWHPSWAPILGVWAGWLCALLVGRSDLVEFPYVPPPGGILNLCSFTKYPKHQDYYWYMLMLAGGGMGAISFAGLRWFLLRRGIAGGLGSAVFWTGVAALGVSTALSFSVSGFRSPVTPALILLGAALPWFWKEWYRPVSGPSADTVVPRRLPGPWVWIVASVVASLVTGFDSCLAERWIDGYHEGNQLLLVQGYLAGDIPGVDVRTFYGPLHAKSLVAWMEFWGLTMSAERWYFLVANLAGTATCYMLLRLVCRCWLSAGVGAWMVLTMTVGVSTGYGWANALRMAVPLASLVFLWTGLRSKRRGFVVASGVLVACAVLYSQEYGMACLVSSLVLIGGCLRALGIRPTLRVALVWAGVGLVGWAGFGLLALGGSFFGGVGYSTSANYAVVHLLGHEARPLPEYPWGISMVAPLDQLLSIVHLGSIWGPGMLCVVVSAWLLFTKGREWDWRIPLAAALVVLVLLAQLPVLVRPLGQIGTAMSAVVFLLVVVLDILALGDGNRWALRVLAALCVLHGAVKFVYPVFPGIMSRYVCDLRSSYILARGTAIGPLHRLGAVRLWDRRDRHMKQAFALMKQLCGRGDRIYVGAPFYAHLCFLADVPGLRPFPVASMAATRDERLQAVESLERYKPPVALVTDASVDVPYAYAHPEEWAYIQQWYDLHAQMDDLKIYVRTGARALQFTFSEM